MQTRTIRNSLLAASILLTTACGEECFQGVRIIQSVTDEDRNTIEIVVETFPKMLGQSINCVDIELYYGNAAFVQKMKELDKYQAGIRGLCRHHGDYHVVYVERSISDDLFLFILIHELCHTIGYEHGSEMDAAIDLVFDEVVEILNWKGN